MKPLELALNYIEIFYLGKNLEKLKDILSDDLSFTGPFYTLNSAEDYINSLKMDPPQGMKYKIIKTFEDDNGVCLISNFQKENISTTMTQLFEIKDEKISKTNLIFDTKAFLQ